MTKKSESLSPDFIIIGAGKAGTTSLTNYLDQHPDIAMSDTREPNFFAYEGKKDVTALTNWDEYKNTFKHSKAGQKLGEASPMYLYSEQAPVNIKKHVPDVKLIAILRHPADRLYSRYMQLARKGQVPTEKFEEVFDRESIWWKRADLVPEGFYFTYLKRYFDNFLHSNLKIFLYEDLVENPKKLYSDICDFINVDSDFTPDFGIKLNQSGNIKNPLVDSIIGINSPIKKRLKRYFPALFKKLKSMPSALKQLNKFRSFNLSKPELSSSLRDRLITDVYKSEINNLEKLIGRDLGHWLVTSSDKS